MRVASVENVAIPAPPLEAFREGQVAPAKNLNIEQVEESRAARWDARLAAIRDKLRKMLDEERPFTVSAHAHTPEEGADLEPALGEIETVILSGEAKREAIGVLRKPEIGKDGVLFFRLRIPPEIDPEVDEWELVLVTKTEIERVGKPQRLQVGVETKLEFNLPPSLNKQWRQTINQNCRLDELPFSMVLDIPR